MDPNTILLPEYITVDDERCRTYLDRELAHIRANELYAIRREPLAEEVEALREDGGLALDVARRRLAQIELEQLITHVAIEGLDPHR